MYELTINEKNLPIDDGFTFKEKSRVVVENGSGKVVICHIDGKPTFPGGKMDEGEDPVFAAMREVREETGIELLESELSPLFTLVYVTDEFGSFFDGSQGAPQKRVNTTHFFYAKTGMGLKLDNTAYTDNEEEYGFVPTFVPRRELIDEMCADHSNMLNGHHFDIENRQVLIELGWI